MNHNDKNHVCGCDCLDDLRKTTIAEKFWTVIYWLQPKNWYYEFTAKHYNRGVNAGHFYSRRNIINMLNQAIVSQPKKLHAGLVAARDAIQKGEDLS